MWSNHIIHEVELNLNLFRFPCINLMDSYKYLSHEARMKSKQNICGACLAKTGGDPSYWHRELFNENMMADLFTIPFGNKLRWTFMEGYQLDSYSGHPKLFPLWTLNISAWVNCLLIALKSCSTNNWIWKTVEWKSPAQFLCWNIKW